jgi:hypothetical protein
LKENRINPGENIDDRIDYSKIVALWAFSESAFGGILHALSIPLRGLFIASAAVLFISLIALFATNKREILKATLIVILIKAVVSPHSPFTAYLAVSFQGVLGFLIFSTIKYFKLSTILLGVLVLFFSGIQKIIVLTILFGNTLWTSLDVFIKQISIEIFNIEHPEINYAYLIIFTYVMLHLIIGLFIGIYAGKLPDKINYYGSIIPASIENINGDGIPLKARQKKKSWFFRPTGIFVVVISAGVIVLSYTSPELEENVAGSVFIMLVRSIIITIIWYTIISPVTKKLLQKFVAKTKSELSADLENIISMFPQFKVIVNYCWKLSNNKKGFSRIRYFLSTSFYYLLLFK